MQTLSHDSFSVVYIGVFSLAPRLLQLLHLVFPFLDGAGTEVFMNKNFNRCILKVCFCFFLENVSRSPNLANLATMFVMRWLPYSMSSLYQWDEVQVLLQEVT